MLHVLKMASCDLSSANGAPEAHSQVPRRSISNSPSSSVSAESTSGDVKEKSPQEKICVVCGDVATGTHFAAMTCEGCKGFFRRSMKKKVEFTCAFENQCAINKSNRKHCQACRLQKCIDMGMNSSLIMSDESVEKKRALIKMNRERKAALKLKKQQEEMEQREQKQEAPSEQVIKLSEEDKALIKMMLASHEQSYDFSYEGYEKFRGNDQIAAPDPQELALQNSTLAWFAAETKNSSPTPQSKGRKTKTESLDSSENTLSSCSDVPSKEHSPFGGFNLPDLCSAGLGEFGDMFSTLHGTQKPSFLDNILHNAVAMPNPMPRINSDGSASSSSSSPYMSSNSAQGFDGFPAMFPPPLEDSNGNMLSNCQDLPGIGMYNMDLLESLQGFQGMFNNGQAQEHRQHSLFQHFCDIMTWGIKKVIEFCKCIPEFKELETVDQINLLRGGCLEMLVLRSYFAFASEGDKYKSDKFEYSPQNFKEAGASSEFIEQYMKVHERMRKMNLKVEEICLLLGLVLFSTDRPGIQDCAKVEAMQKRIAQALRAYEYTNHDPDKACVIYSELLLLLPVLRTINVLFSNTIFTLKNQNEMDPLILEVNN